MFKIRIHNGNMETKYGVDNAFIYDDPVSPKYSTDKDIINKLMNQLGYVEAESDNSEYPGYYDDDIGAYFEYAGYVDVPIPESIVERIKQSVK